MQVPMTLAMVGKEDTSRKQEPACLPIGEPTTASEQDADPLDCHFSLTDDREMSECFQHLPAEECCLNLPEDPAVDNPWTARPLRSSKMLTKNFNKQQQSMLINTHARVFVEWMMSFAMSSQETLQQIEVWPCLHQCYNWPFGGSCRITGRPGSKRLHMQMSTCYSHSKLRISIDNYHCDHCQRNSLMAKGMDTCRNARFILCHSRNAP